MIQWSVTVEDLPMYSQLVEHVRDKFRIVVREYGCLFQDIRRKDCSGNDGGSYSGVWIGKNNQCINIRVKVLWMGEAFFFNTFMHGGDWNWGKVSEYPSSGLMWRSEF